jgi:ABC-type Co2+ transport system permease subunit
MKRIAVAIAAMFGISGMHLPSPTRASPHWRPGTGTAAMSGELPWFQVIAVQAATSPRMIPAPRQ